MKTVRIKRKDQLEVPTSTFETLPECVTSAGGEDKIVRFLNLYASQKDVLPEAFDDLVAAVEAEGKFERLHKKEKRKVGDKEVEFKVFVEPHDTEGHYLADFREHASKNGVHALGLHADPTGKAVFNWLQEVLNRKLYALDLSKAGRSRKTTIDANPAKTRKLP